jgi:hypothetical protein
MSWTVRYFRWQEMEWRERLALGGSIGHEWYALRQASMWARFSVAAIDSFALAGVQIL